MLYNSKMKFTLDLFGSKCNNYPIIDILQNQQSIFSGEIIESTKIELDLSVVAGDIITIQGINKQSGENGIWDTVVDDQGQVLQDKYLLVHNIWFDDIPMESEWLKNLTAVYTTHSEKFNSCGFWQNGFVEFSIHLPLLDWIIEEKYIKLEQAQDFLANQRSGENRFEYDFINERIHYIRKLLND
jgi:hypothetical protein